MFHVAFLKIYFSFVLYLLISKFQICFLNLYKCVLLIWNFTEEKSAL